MFKPRGNMPPQGGEELGYAFSSLKDLVEIVQVPEQRESDVRVLVLQKGNEHWNEVLARVGPTHQGGD